jgi:hypothetical protein
MIDIRDDQWYDDLMALESFVHNLSEGEDRLTKVSRFKRFCEAAQHHPEKWKVIHDLKRKYLHLSKELLVEEEYLVRERVNPAVMFVMGILHLLLGVLALPAFLVYSPFNSAVENFVKTRVKDPLFYNSIRLVFWVFGSPIWTLLIAALPAIFFSDTFHFGYSVLLLLSSGVVALKWWPFFKKWRMTWRLFWQSRIHKDKFVQWLETRQSLKKTISDILQ